MLVTYFTHAKTAFVHFKYIYPECFTLIENYTQASPLMCIQRDCPANKGCMEVVAKRVNYFFENVSPESQMILAYFKYRDKVESVRAGVFLADLTEPRLITLNRAGFNRYQKEGDIKQWNAPSEYININGIIQLPQIIPASSLIK